LEWRFESAEQIYPSTMHRDLMALLHREGTPDSDFSSAELIYGELISNAIRHAPGGVQVRLDWDGEFPRLSVLDEARYPPPTISLPADPLAESGRGLYIVKRLAKHFALIDAGKAGSEASAILPVKRRVA
jgi:anti-sigma regulatory factor (Ser/Thr protein kinase)